jgi:two-component sensor histidine kinase
MDQALAIHTFYTKDLKPQLFELTDASRPEGYFEPSWMSSSYAVRRIGEYFHTFSPIDYYYKDAVIDARNPGNEANELERAFIHDLNADTKLVTRSSVVKEGDESYFVYLRRGEVLEESCLRCHGEPYAAPEDLLAAYGAERGFHRAPELGSTISAISIRIPVTESYAKAKRFATVGSSAIFGVLALLLLIQGVLSNKLFFKPLEAIRAKALLISTDESQLGESLSLPRGQELGEMVKAFNAMSAALRRSHDLLEDRIAARTAELTESNAKLEWELAEKGRAEAALRDTLQANERLLHELQHRAKNSFSMIGAMIQLAATQDSSDAARNALDSLDSRVRSISELYSLLYSSDSFDAIKLDDYCVHVAAPIVALVENLSLKTELETLYIPAKDAAPIGIIVNELVTNAVKYAFPGKRKGTLSLSLHASAGMATLEIRDDGVGLAAPLNPAHEGGGMGLGLVKALAEQVHGSFAIGDEPGGARFSITFPVGQRT